MTGSTGTRPIGIGLTLILAAILLGAAATHGLTAAFDADLLRRMALVRGQSNQTLIAGTQFVSSLGLPGWRTIVTVVFLVAMLILHHARSAMIYAVTVIGSITGYTALKLAFARARPALTPWLDQPQNLSFPSGHAAGSMVVLLLAALLLDPRRHRRHLPVAAVALSLAIGFARPMLGVHWPTDVIGGWLFGAGSALIGVGLVRPSSSARA